MRPFTSQEVEARFSAWPETLRNKLIGLREIIFDIDETLDGDIEESLKWNVPSYLNRNGGTPIRLDAGRNEGAYGLYVHCQTTLISSIREMYPDVFTYEKNRAVIFAPDDAVAEKELHHFISMALTYHRK